MIPVGTKVATASSIGAGRGELRPEAVRQSANASLQRMKILDSSSPGWNQGRRLQWLIAQRPDVGISYGEMAGGFTGLIGEGICEEVSISIENEAIDLVNVMILTTWR
jgi:hypothetical protein